MKDIALAHNFAQFAAVLPDSHARRRNDCYNGLRFGFLTLWAFSTVCIASQILWPKYLEGETKCPPAQM